MCKAAAVVENDEAFFSYLLFDVGKFSCDNATHDVSQGLTKKPVMFAFGKL